MTPQALSAFFAENPDAILCEITHVKGSSPRAEGTFMVVGATLALGTIGGGALEYMVIDHARRLITAGRAHEVMDVPLGPEIGQCCGGRVRVDLSYVTDTMRAELVARCEAELAQRPSVFVFGAGHVGRVLAHILSLMPVRLEVIDTRKEELAALAPQIASRLVAMPEMIVRQAPAGSSFVIVTHDHALDFLIAHEALSRRDTAYVGMVGSQTKRAKFTRWYRDQGGDALALNKLILPIGAQGLGDKRPAVIAAFAAAEIMAHVGSQGICARDNSSFEQTGVARGF
ncbi:xanthine dehydrogenase accessory protein XdhC [Devosia sp. WQ 349]|uniref:xanthine dehydrogenase accessory protein XdhC n=1 Tax=Devosia sp. WQ 349K1 TaxID=2800329 RepID=UPI001907A891|nr:xanthine dehydrogenase accessory protein XdhC [Devosia sp. WQ 349K1]MBK1794002.1 xanthine dehydrogenase accessory protein XdhC [Devosia sp. WQ 349K1]